MADFPGDNTEKDLQDVKLARPVSVVDVWDLDDRIKRLERVTEQLEKVAELLGRLYESERVRNWEMILAEIMKKDDLKKGNNGNRARRC